MIQEETLGTALEQSVVEVTLSVLLISVDSYAGRITESIANNVSPHIRGHLMIFK